MRTQAILLTLFSVLVLVSSATWAAKTEVPHLTLSDMEETYSLEVLWQFLPGDDLGWGAPAYDDRGWQKKRIPEVWPKGGYPESGQIAWYRLSLSFDPQQRDELSHIGVRMGKVLSAYEFYAGGELLGGVGKLPPLGEVNYGRTRLYAIPPSAIADDGTLVLALRVWGGSDLAAAKWGGGPREEAFQIGSYARLLQGSFISDISRLNMCVLLLAFGC